MPEYPNYTMENALTQNQLVVNTVKDFSMLFVVSMELLMTISVTCNVPKSIFSVEDLVHQSELTVNVIRDMFLFVVLTIRPIEMTVSWNVLKSENNTMVFVEIMKSIIQKFSENANVEINNRPFVELMEEPI